jgi:two-component system, OmpR family, phosphate regulon sensor histidine kinase PhoR
MNKRVVYTVIFIMTVAMLVLSAVQLYWIRNALALKEANFDRGVNEAMTNVIYKLEKYEVVERIRDKMYKHKQGARLLNTIDSINAIYKKELEKHSGDTNRFSERIFNVTSEKINVTVLQEHTGEIIKTYDTTIVSIQKKPEQGSENEEIISGVPGIFMRLDSLTYKDFNSVEQRIDKYLDKTSLVKDVFDDLFSLKYFDSFENRLNMALLDTLISDELSNSGIYTGYEFGVFSPLRKVMLIEKTGHYHRELLEKGYAFNLFPRDLFMTPEYLMIYFPNKEGYLWKQMWKLLLISAIIILTIVFSFVYTIRTIFRQKRLSEMKNDFINNMTHEFKTPISTISLACEALNDPDVMRTEALHKNYIHVIGDENKRLGSMAEKILQTAVIDKGQLKLHVELINIHQIIADVIKNIQLQVDVRGGKIITELKARNYYLKADKTHLTNVIYNIIDNANKYSPESPEITVKTKNHKQGVLITVEDKGIGISKVNQKKVFEKLYRVSTGNIHNVKGFGLGLHYVKTIVEMHGGKVEIESELKRGTRIIIDLPFQK